ncbi:exodeoxyribonuclease VII large subunit [Myroides sp. DW712]|uniref:exodeoxyribonuclease VII large subunit n=1 Tax=Myroides sp. DW712 TaxID=3389800 RepID=UPI00397C159D
MEENRTVFTLHVILNRVQHVFEERMQGKFFWIKVEVLKVNIDRKGHYYLELVEQVEDVVLAKCRATIWARNVERCVLDEEGDLRKVIKEGEEILCYCEVVFHPVYVFSLNIIHVDYAFSLGEIERKKQQALLLLQKKGLIGRNKGQKQPLVIQKIAVIASVGTSGYEDFVQHLKNNPYGFAFILDCYDTPVQGEGAVAQLVHQFEVVAQKAYDAVVLIRGGGSKFDLDVFNQVALAEQIAKMPVVVFTGIGHETDMTVADYVAHTYFKTPSAVAAYLIELAFQFDGFLTHSQSILQESMRQFMGEHKGKLDQHLERLQVLSKLLVQVHRGNLMHQMTALRYEIKSFVEQATNDLRFIKQGIHSTSKVTVKKHKNDLLDRSTFLSLYGKQSLALASQKIGLVEEMLLFRLRHQLTKERVQLTQIGEILSVYGIENILKKGFAVIRYQGKVLDEHTVLNEGDELELTIYNKTYQIKLASIKEIEQWKNLRTKQQQQN